MKFKEIKDLNKVELRKRLDQLNHEIFDSKMKLQMQRLPDPLTVRRLRKDRARIQTALHTIQIRALPTEKVDKK